MGNAFQKGSGISGILFLQSGPDLTKGADPRSGMGNGKFVEDGNVDTYIHFVRRRLAAVSSDLAIKNVHGVGYRLETPQSKRN